jgi:DNA-binding PadR family transcriptional regulator
MSLMFRHGRLRLYLLKLLDEAPRHGYEIIRMLQDRFLGVYAPSPGTIYPRLARLEEEGLVTHDVVAGKKVYRITAKGRGELRARLDDLAELEETITASVQDIAREVSEDVRETVRGLREELASAARDIQGRARQGGRAREAGRGWEAARAVEAGAGPGGYGDPHGYRDLDRLARRFTRELQAAAWQAPAVSEDALRALRAILNETIDRIRGEVFPGDEGPGGDAGPGGAPGSGGTPGPGGAPGPGAPGPGAPGAAATPPR